jgi:anti-sigma B factor antagonist
MLTIVNRDPLDAGWYAIGRGFPLALNLTTRIVGDVTVIDVSGRLTLGPGPEALRDMFHDVMTSGARKIVLNLRELFIIDSSGLGELAAGHTNAKHHGCALKITGVPKRVLELLSMTGLNRVLDIHDDEAEALRGWGVSPSEVSRPGTQRSSTQ